MLGRATGVCGGRAGSMNVVDLEHGLVGCFGIVGGSIGAATGAAVSAQRQGRVAVGFFGDGASNQGYFHESLNWAQVFALPIVYVCENNFYGEFTPMASVTAGGEIGIRAASFGMQSQVVDGNDLWAVREAALEAVARAREGAGPTLLECQTYRHYGHSKSDPAKYRPPEEVERWLARDPLDLARARLLDLGLDEDDVSAKDAEVEALAGGVFMTTPGLHEKHGQDRVFDTPISELAMAGAAFGAAVTGLRPVIEIMFGDFMALPMDSLVNQSAKFWYVSNEQASVPLVVRSAVGAGGRFGAMHSQIHGTWFQGIPGIKVVAPSNPADAKGLLKSAIRDDNPVIFLEHKRLYSMKGPEPAEETVPLGKAAVAREGGDITLVSALRGVRDCLEAAEELASDGIDAEVVDIRSLRPLDHGTVLESVAKTNRVMLVEEGTRVGGWAGNLLGILAAEGLHDLDDAWIVATEDTPAPYSPTLEDAWLPGGAEIAAAVRERLGVSARV